MVNVSLFACNLLDGVTFTLFSVNAVSELHLTDNTGDVK